MAIIPPVIVVMEKACRSAAKGLVRDFGELEKLQISKKIKMILSLPLTFELQSL